MNVAINYEYASVHLLELAREKKTEAIASIIEERSKDLDSAASVDKGEEQGEPNVCLMSTLIVCKGCQSCPENLHIWLHPLINEGNQLELVSTK